MNHVKRGQYLSVKPEKKRLVENTGHFSTGQSTGQHDTDK